MSDGGMETNGPVDPHAEADALIVNSPDAELAGALLDLVRDTEAGLDIATKRLERDASVLPIDKPDQLAKLTTEAAYVAGQRDVLDRVVEAIASVATNRVEDTEKKE